MDLQLYDKSKSPGSLSSSHWSGGGGVLQTSGGMDILGKKD